MENDKFDNIIKKALENLEADIHTADWSAMEKKLELDERIHSNEMDDVMIDTMVFGNLENLEVPYKEENWNIMEAKLDEEFSFRKSIIYRYKLAEVALMLLAIFTLFQYIPLHKQDDPEKDIVVSNEQQMNFFSENTISLTEEKSSDKLQNKNSNNNNNTSQQTNSTTNSPIEDNLAITQKQLVTTTKDIVQNPNPAIPKEISNTENTSTIVFLSNHSIATNFNLQHAISRIQGTNAKILQEISTDKSLPLQSKINITSLDLANLDLLDIPPYLLAEKTIAPNSKPIDITVGMFATGDYNFINTPYDEIFSAKATRSGALGYSGGLSIGFVFGKWQLETGFIYSSKTYRPKTKGEIYGNFDAGYLAENFDEFELDILQIPLNLQYSLTNSNKWRLYSSLGGSLNTLIQANYDRTIKPEPGFIGLKSGTGASSGIKEIREKESNLFIDKEIPKGLFEGGSFTRNSYITLNLGFGIERNLSPRWSTFIETSYHHHLFSLHKKGIGPNSDNINSFRLMAGTKVHLRKK